MLITEYKKFIHYGCSYTYGEDSGGDAVDDDSLSYPAHLSRIVGNEYINRARKGSSNDLSFSKLHADILSGEADTNTVIFFNLASISRTIYINKDMNNFINLPEEQYRYMSIIPNYAYPVSFFNKFKIKHYLFQNYVQSYYAQEDIAFQFNLMKNILAARELCKNYDIPIVFVDMACNLHNEQHNKYVDYKKFNIVSPDRDSFAGAVLKEKQYTSKSYHLYSEGYKRIAEMVYAQIRKTDA